MAVSTTRVAEPPEAFGRLARLLKPGGVVVICDFFRTEHDGDGGPGDKSFGGGHDLQEFYELVKSVPFEIETDRDITPLLEETADAIAEAGVVVDVNAAGLRKPVGEIYPSQKFLEMFHRRGVHIILSSDAHASNEVAAGYDQSLKLVHDVGYREVATFKDRERGTLPL